VVAVALLAAACGGAADGSTDGPRIVATTSIMGDVTAQLVGDAAAVTVLMDAGADPHNFEPSARQLGDLTDADLIVANGGGLEAQLAGPIDEAERAGVPVFQATDHIELLPADDHADAYDPTDTSQPPHASDRPADGGHGHGSADPHFWMDPLRMAEVVRALGRQVGAATDTPQRSADRALRYAAELRALDERIEAVLADVPEEQRTLVTNHETLGYLADRYGFTVVGTVIPGVTTGAEPTAQDMEDLTHVIRDTGVQAIFTDSTAPTDLAQTLAAEAGTDVQVVQLYSEALGVSGSRAATYVDMLETDAGRIARALGG
jgi:zinc/manganese transport system substrate-binding protein